MSSRLAAGAVFLAAVVLHGAIAQAQSFDAVGTRARGMGGAFVAVADDASAVYWNPGGLAKGAYFSLLLDGRQGEASPEGALAAGSSAGSLLALGTPALGIAYYRLREARVAPPAGLSGGGVFALQTLVTHHAGVTVVQSLSDGIALGVTGKLIRGIAGTAVTAGTSAGDLLDEVDLLARAGNRLDLDVGIMASGSAGSVGLTVRNVTEPGFESADGVELELERQVRAGASIFLLPSWRLAADADFTTTTGGAAGPVRELALGTEAQVSRRVAARGGLRLNTASGAGRTPALSVGGSYALLGSLLVDVQVTAGSDETLRGWGVAGRVIF